MASPRAVRLDVSNEVLYHPNGDIEIEVLERILSEATERELDINKLIRTIRTNSHERVANFNPDNPKWKNVPCRVPLRELFSLYEEITGRQYRKPTIEEIERDARRKAARAVW